tara:strand:- start:299 stop:538 length:240 start_codon:yes stop_codon:yes gene_type:complete
MKCLEVCQELECACPVKECRSWIDYEEDYNCIHEAISKHGAMTLREVADRMGVSFVRIKQIEEKALKKMSKRTKNELRD